MAEQYGRFAEWHDSAALDENAAHQLVARLERRAQSPDEIAMRTAYLDLLEVRSGERALDVGCGGGAVTRELARRVAPSGLVVGLDPSPVFLGLARELAKAAGLGECSQFRRGDARSLPCADQEFDVVVAATVLGHIPDGERAVPELVRVVRPGGRVGIFDIDLDSFIVAHPDRELTRRIIAAYSDQSAVDSWLCRRLPGLLAAAGLTDVRVRAFTSLDRDPSGFNASRAERRAELAVRAGAIAEADRLRWLDALHAEQQAGRFLAGQTYLFTWGRRPVAG